MYNRKIIFFHYFKNCDYSLYVDYKEKILIIKENYKKPK